MEESTLEALGKSLAGTNEWVSTGILVEVHDSIDSSSEATEVDIASTMGFAQVGGRIAFDETGVSNFRILCSNHIFESCVRTVILNLSPEIRI
jgi:hypothetical protein